MKTLRLMVSGCIMVGVAVSSMASVGCATHERVVVRERPLVVTQPVVQERVVVTQPVVQERVIVTQPVVQERVIVRP